MDSAFLRAFPSDIKRPHSWSKSVYRRKLIKNLLLIIKDNIDSYCKSIPKPFENLIVVLSKVFSSLDISQLQLFMDIAQIVCRFGTASPFTPCIEYNEALYESFGVEYILKIFWTSFRFSDITSSGSSFNVLKFCSGQRICINPFHCSLIKDVHSMDPRSNISTYKSTILKTIHCDFYFDHHKFPTKVFAPPLSSLSSLLAIYYQPSYQIHNDNSLWQELGICFYQVDKEFVLLYNFSSYVVFISSVSMELKNLPLDINQHDLQVPVHRVLPNQSIRVISINNVISMKNCPLSIPLLNSGIVSVQISFGKGWGKGYSRTSFIYCPRRCEVSVKIPLQELHTANI